MPHVQMDLIPRPVLDTFLRQLQKEKQARDKDSSCKATPTAVDLGKMEEDKLVSTLMQFQREGVQ